MKLDYFKLAQKIKAAMAAKEREALAMEKSALNGLKDIAKTQKKFMGPIDQKTLLSTAHCEKITKQIYRIRKKTQLTP